MTRKRRSIGVSTCVAVLALLTAQSALAQRDLVIPKIDAPTGMNSVSVFGTLISTLGKDQSSTVPGLSTTINVPANTTTIISTDGGVELWYEPYAGKPGVDISLLIDGAAPSNGGHRQIRVYSGTWSMQMAVELTPGVHTIEVKAANASYGLQGFFPAPALVSGGAGSNQQGTLTVTTLKR